MQDTQANVTGRKVFGAPKARRIPEACAALGIGRSTIYALAAEGKIRLIHIGRRTLVPERKSIGSLRKGRLNVVAPTAKEPGGGSAPPAGLQSDRFDGRIAASPIPADQIAKRTRVFATVYSALLAIDDYTAAAREALRGGDDSDARLKVAVLRGLAEVAAAQLHSLAPEYSVQS